MILLQRCQYCGDLATQGSDGDYVCDRLDCAAAQLVQSD